MSLPSTESYQIVVAKDPEHDGIDCYAVLNKEHEVFEYYDNLLPRTYQAMVQMEEKYREMELAISGGGQQELSLVTSIEPTSH